MVWMKRNTTLTGSLLPIDYSVMKLHSTRTAADSLLWSDCGFIPDRPQKAQSPHVFVDDRPLAWDQRLQYLRWLKYCDITAILRKEQEQTKVVKEAIRSALHRDILQQKSLIFIAIWSISCWSFHKLVIHFKRQNYCCRYSWSKKMLLLFAWRSLDILGTIKKRRNSSYRWATGQGSFKQSHVLMVLSKDLSVSTNWDMYLTQIWIHGQSSFGEMKMVA